MSIDRVQELLHSVLGAFPYALVSPRKPKLCRVAIRKHGCGGLEHGLRCGIAVFDPYHLILFALVSSSQASRMKVLAFSCSKLTLLFASIEVTHCKVLHDAPAFAGWWNRLLPVSDAWSWWMSKSNIMTTNTITTLWVRYPQTLYCPNVGSRKGPSLNKTVVKTSRDIQLEHSSHIMNYKESTKQVNQYLPIPHRSIPTINLHCTLMIWNAQSNRIKSTCNKCTCEMVASCSISRALLTGPTFTADKRGRNDAPEANQMRPEFPFGVLCPITSAQVSGCFVVLSLSFWVGLQGSNDDLPRNCLDERSFPGNQMVSMDGSDSFGFRWSLAEASA